MYNEQLNEAMVDKLRAYVDNQRVLLVGNAATLFSNPRHGEIIDSYDVVLRFGKGVPFRRWRQYLGTRTDAWFFGAGRTGCWTSFRHVPYKIMTMSQIHAYSKADTIAIHKALVTGREFQIYRDFMLTGDLDYLHGVTLDVHGTLENAPRVSQGVQAAHFFDRVVKSQKSLDFIGFDFFGAGFKYSFPDNRTYQGEAIPNVHPITSWHCPLTGGSYNGNPHGDNADHASREEQFIRSLKNSHVHEMPKEVDRERIEMVLKDLRGEKCEIIETFKQQED